jgi:hypothetical protein
LPVAGLLAAGGLLFFLTRKPANVSDVDARFVFGNPAEVAARRESRGAAIESRPLVEAMRTLEEDDLGAMIHGMRGMSPPRQSRHLLGKFTDDSQAALQFAAQGIVASHTELHERQIKELKQRIAANPEDHLSRQAAAASLLALGEWLPPGDMTALVYAREAQALVAPVPASRASTALRARVAHVLRKPSGIAAEVSPLLAMESAFLAGDFATVRAIAQQVQPVPAGASAIVSFWRGEGCL